MACGLRRPLEGPSKGVGGGRGGVRDLTSTPRSYVDTEIRRYGGIGPSVMGERGKINDRGRTPRYTEARY